MIPPPLALHHVLHCEKHGQIYSRSSQMFRIDIIQLLQSWATVVFASFRRGPSLLGVLARNRQFESALRLPSAILYLQRSCSKV